MDPFEDKSTDDSRLEFDDPEHRAGGHSSSDGSGTGKLLTMFFGAAVVCAIFFGLGYKMGKGATQETSLSVVDEPKPVASSAPKPSAMTEPGSRVTPEVADAERPSTSETSATTTAAKNTAPSAKLRPASSPASLPAAGHATGNFAVQVAAVTKEEDADALVSALRKKDYPVFVVGNQAGDKLFHVQVGPFNSLADAETMRARLAADGYNPIVKK